MNTGNFSTYNQDILLNYYKELWKGIGTLPYTETNSATGSVISRLFNKTIGCLPASETVGTYGGQAIVRAHGGDLNRGVINFAYNKLFGSHMGSALAKEGFHLATSPYIIPLLEKLGMAVGGLSVPAVIWLCSFLYDKAFSSSEGEITIYNAPDIEQLLKEGEDGSLKDALENPLGPEDIKYIKKTIARMNVVFKFVSADKDSLDEVLGDYIKLRSDNHEYYYIDGKKLSDKEVEKMEKAYETLKNNSNLARKSKHIRFMIEKIAKHCLLGTKPNSFVSNQFLIYEDGCISEKNGMTVSSQEYDRRVKEEEDALEAIIDDFVLI